MGDFDRLAAIATHVGVSTTPFGAEAPRRRCRRRTQGCSLLYAGDVILAVRSCRVRLSRFSPLAEFTRRHAVRQTFQDGSGMASDDVETQEARETEETA